MDDLKKVQLLLEALGRAKEAILRGEQPQPGQELLFAMAKQQLDQDAQDSKGENTKPSYRD